MTETEKILEMISEGKISADDGERLLNAIHGKESSKVPKSINKIEQSSNQDLNEGNIIIEIKSTDCELIKLNLPVEFARFMLNMVTKDKISEFEMNGINLQEILNSIPKMSIGEDQEILNFSTEDGTSIKIYVKYQ
ncbi:MAG: hypothetical protein HOD92_25705 [Deltaproteobacteria bacterium]|jgi:hypothetical protein|nr:hypothetical protein [Deltaproteobacteria bacterium]MBT4525457.1 hypothetical protein [Deltaproteobacteria bacterium]